ncbi:MAG: RNA polymerase sigma factor [Phycisphaeraceae bacterium]|nr:RNA polymerase sigma factor [Phycisphaerales bacterium]MCB9859035.1 RNA polymerase sigma factor [Phycisphaeraceae bacterium]
MKRAEEQLIIAQALAGDRKAAGALVRAHQRSLYVYLYRLTGQHELAEDIVQDAFIRALTNLHTFDPKYRFSTWLFSIARNVWMSDLSKKTRRRTLSISMDAASCNSEADPYTNAERENTALCAREALGKAILSLPVAQREVVLLYHQQQWSISLIAKALDIPEGTVKSQLHRARRRLHKAMLAAGLQYSPGLGLTSTPHSELVESLSITKAKARVRSVTGGRSTSGSFGSLGIQMGGAS